MKTGLGRHPGGVPYHPLALLDAREAVTYVTLRGLTGRAGSLAEATETLAQEATLVGRPIRVLVWGPDGLQVWAVAPDGAMVDPDSVQVPPVGGSPIPAEALAGWREEQPQPQPTVVVTPPPPVPGPERPNLTPGPRPALRVGTSGHLTVMVANPKGGTGKTPISVVLSAALASVRPKDVALVETNPTGNIGLRTGASAAARSVPVLSRWLVGLPQLPYPTELFEGVHWCRPGFYVVPTGTGVVDASGPSPMLAEPMTATDLDRVLVALRKNLGLVVLDTGNDPSSPVWQAAVRAADVIVVPVRWTRDATGAARQMLDDLWTLGYQDLVQRAIVMPTWGPRDRPARGAATEHSEWFLKHGLRTWPLPPDKHLAERGEIVWGRLRPTTRSRAEALAEQLLLGVG